MAIKPEECLALTPDDLSQLTYLESNIDAFLKENFTNTGMIVSFPISNKLNGKVITAITNLYSKSGWDVNQVNTPASGSDMRELDCVKESWYLEFKELKRPSYVPGGLLHR